MGSHFLAELSSLGTPEIIILAIVFATFLFWIWMIIDCATKEDGNQILLLLLVVIGGVMGAAVYFFVRKLPRGRLS